MRQPAPVRPALAVCCVVIALILVTTAFTLAAGASNENDLLLLTASTRVPLPDAAVSSAIGGAGGTVRLGGVTATLPAGALDTATTVTLSRARSDSAFSLMKTTVYTLDVPDNPCINQPMTVSMGVGGGNRTVYVGLGDAYEDVSGGNSNATRPTIIPGQVTGGVLTFAIPGTDICPSVSNNPAAIMAARTQGATPNALPTRSSFSFLIVSGYLTLASTHFKVNYPSSIIAENEDLPQKLLEYAESAYTLLTGLGFSFDTAITWPMAINVEWNMGERVGETCIPLAGKARQYLNINADKCATSNLDLLKVTIGHEFFHAVQTTYDPRSALRIRHTWSTPVFLWLSEASSVWFESRMLGSSAYVADVFVNNIDEKTHGLDCFLSTHEIAQNVGYWASGFLRYLTTAKSDALLPAVWNEVRDEGKGSSAYSDLTALIRAVGSGVDTAIFWQQYLSKVVSHTTGYSGWPLPTTDRTWYSQASGAGESQIFSTTLYPFSGEKWLIGYNSEPTSGTIWFKATTVDPDIAYDLYRGQNADGPFTFLATLVQDQRKETSVSQGDVFLVSATNSNTTAPYQTPKTASIAFGNEGQCSLCDGMPANLDVYNKSGVYEWYTTDTGILVATAILGVDARPYRLWCYDATTGNMKLVKFYYDNLNLWYEEPCDATSQTCIAHGTYKEYYDNGHLHRSVTYVHGETIGLTTEFYNTPNTIGASGNYVSGGRQDGTWSYYDQSGKLYMTCVYSNGTLVGDCTNY